jgi:hypothetical protein
VAERDTYKHNDHQFTHTLWRFSKSATATSDCLQSIQLHMEYNPLACYGNNGAEPKIKDFDDSANVIYTALQTGMSYPQVTSLVNMARLREGKKLVFCSAVQNFIRNSEVVDISKKHLNA